MSYSIVRYSVKPDASDENHRLVCAVFQELHDAKPEGLRYASLSLGGGAFLHIVGGANGSPSLTTFPAFQAFQAHIDERLVLGPEISDASVVGNYRLLLDAASES